MSTEFFTSQASAVPSTYYMFGLLTVGLLIAVVTDVRYHRIPNRLTALLALTGLVFHTYINSLSGLLFSGAGLLLGLGLLMPLYLFGGMGAGDVKLMGAVGALLGAKSVLGACLFSALAGGLYAVIMLLASGGFKETAARYGRMGRCLLWTGRFIYLPPRSAQRPVLCYGIAIAAGTLAHVVRPIL